MRKLFRTAALIGAFAAAGVAAEAADEQAEAAAAIEAAVEEWSAAARAKDAEKFASFYAEDAVLLLERAPDARGIDAIRAAISGMMQDPHFELVFAADEVVAARSGDLAYETGSYTLTVSDPQGNPATVTGHYVDVWKKGADGAWKVALDAPVSDPAEE